MELGVDKLQKPALAVYKRMLKLAQRLPATDRMSAKEQIRAAFRENKEERNEAR